MIETITARVPAWQVYVYYKAAADQVESLVSLSTQVFEQLGSGPWGAKVIAQRMRRADTADGGPVTLMEIYTPHPGSYSVSSRVSFLHDFKELSTSIWKTLEGSPVRVVEVFESLPAPASEDTQCA